MAARILILTWLLAAGFAWADPVPLRIVASNLTSGNHQSYSPDNGNHSNPEGAGARILKGLKPDVVLVQEFNTAVPARQWVNATFGEKFSFSIEADAQIPNGIVSRFPIVESGEWKDATVPNRDFAWAKIALPNGKFLWAISVHLYSKKPQIRAKEAQALVALMKEHIPEEDLVVLGGDFNTATDGENCLAVLAPVFDTKTKPVDQAGDADTNANRNKPYDHVVADKELAACAVPVKVGLAEFSNGLVFDSRVFNPLADVAPAQKTDSAAPNMQHMAVVRDFVVP
jgi:endonuclease/exonuclease/phosphatase family metal-dependent hydrolase